MLLFYSPFHALGLKFSQHYSKDDIQSAYRKAALKTHPDKTTDTTWPNFHHVQEARQYLHTETNTRNIERYRYFPQRPRNKSLLQPLHVCMRCGLDSENDSEYNCDECRTGKYVQTFKSCPECCMVLLQGDLSKHLRKDHNACSICWKTEVRGQIEHLQTHKLLGCHGCNTEDVVELTQHILEQHFKCFLCFCTVQHDFALEHLTEEHLLDPCKSCIPFSAEHMHDHDWAVCPLACSSRFEEGAIWYHLQTKHGTQRCDSCPRHSVRVTRTHLAKSHSVLKCDFCDLYVSQNKKWSHLTTAHNWLPCSYCAVAASDPNSLQLHVAEHCVQSCIECPTTLPADSMTEHYAQSHKWHICPFCQAAFEDLWYHIQSEHKRCPSCPYVGLVSEIGHHISVNHQQTQRGPTAKCQACRDTKKKYEVVDGELRCKRCIDGGMKECFLTTIQFGPKRKRK